MRKILVPVDFSDYSLNALEMACYIAKVKDMEIRILHVIEDFYIPQFNMVGVSPVESDTLTKYRTELQESLKSQLSQLAEKTRQKNLKAEYELVSNRVYKGIINDAEVNQVDLIVMGS